MYYVYILYSEIHQRYYVGQTNDLKDRINRHNSGYVSSTKDFIPWEIVWYTEKPNRAEAMALERKLKKINSKRKREFIEKCAVVPFLA